MIWYAAGASVAWGFALTVDKDFGMTRMLLFATALLLTFLTLNAIL